MNPKPQTTDPPRSVLGFGYGISGVGRNLVRNRVRGGLPREHGGRVLHDRPLLDHQPASGLGSAVWAEEFRGCTANLKTSQEAYA